MHSGGRDEPGSDSLAREWQQEKCTAKTEAHEQGKSHGCPEVQPPDYFSGHAFGLIE
jgi:hypothetical protein